ncbi:MAG: sodium:calcium antiporter [Saprospiraceae bacterium]|jgi:cation:H+ antiporter|nr:sodium:calcium antiporter [Saprospiraceae bacterium]
MLNIYLSVTGFIVCTVAIIYSGTKLARYGESIAELTGWGKVWVGLILIASVTTLPELLTGISSVVIIGEPDLAASAVFGSCIFNLLILSFVDTRIKKPLTSLIKPSHLFAGLGSIVLLTISGLSILISDITPTILWISPFTVLIIIIYLFVVYGIYLNEQTTLGPPVSMNSNKTENRKALQSVLKKYILNAVFVIIAAAFLPYFGENIASQTGLGNTFFGTLFLAASTSLPEMVVSFAALRMASYDLLVGNLLGSNIFNMFILALDDIFYTEGSLFSYINKAHLETVIVAIIMTAVIGLGILSKPTKKIWKLSFDTFIILLLYFGLMTVLYIRR